MLKQQSKMAAMGEMMDAVAHQWKQPLNSLSMMNDMLKDDFKANLVNEAYIDEMTETTHTQIEHMVSTLNEFRTFFRPSKDSEEFLKIV
jgi:phosphoglycerate-specific signal transduction histidine kinase